MWETTVEQSWGQRKQLRLWQWFRWEFLVTGTKEVAAQNGLKRKDKENIHTGETAGGGMVLM